MNLNNYLSKYTQLSLFHNIKKDKICKTIELFRDIPMSRPYNESIEDIEDN